MTSAKTILLFGMPRSGTTWLGKLFDSHPYTLYRHEPDSVRRLGLPLYPDVSDTDLYPDRLREFVAALPHIRVPKVAAKQPIFPKAYLSRRSLLAYKTGVAFAKLAGSWGQSRPVWCAPDLDESVPLRLVWKSIESLGRIGVCMAALPQARAVIIVRHPCGYVASVQRGEASNRFDSRSRSSEDYGIFKQLLETQPAKVHGLDVDDLQSMFPEERLAWRWVLTHEKVLQDTKNCERVTIVLYEDLCARPRDVIARLFEFSGLEWSSRTAEFVEASTSTVEGNYYSVFHDPTKSANRWQTDLTAETIGRIMSILQSSSLAALYERETC